MDTARLTLAVDSTPAKKATSDLDNLTAAGKRTEGMASNLKGAFAGVAIGTGIVMALGAIVQNTIAAEKAQAQLAAVVKSTGGAAGLSVEQLNKYADGLQRLTTYDDEAIIGAESLLLTFTQIHADVFPRALSVVLDMSTALGQDLKNSSIQLGKALNDPIKGITALSRVGVSFTADQKKMIASMVEAGKVSEAQTLILKELETEFGNSAKAARDTLGGALEGLQNDFANLLEGDSGDEGIKGATAAINELSATMQSEDTKRGFNTIIQGLASVANFATDAITAVVGLGNAVSQALSTNDKRTYDGLLARRATLEDDIGDAKNKGTGRLNLVLGGRSGAINPFDFAFGGGPDAAIADMQKEIDEIDKRLAQIRVDKAAASIEWIDPPKPRAKMGEDDEDKKTKKVKSNKDALAELAREEEALLRRQKAIEQQRLDAIEQYHELAATLRGPMQEAELRHKQNVFEIEQVTQLANRTDEERAELLKLEEQRYEKERQAIERQLDPIGELINERREELELLKLSPAAYRTQIDLRNLDAKATAEQTAELERLNQMAIDQERATSAMDEFRGNLEDTFASILDGSKSASDAFKDMADAIIAQIARMIAQQWTEKLFGGMGQMGGGSWGDALMGIVGSFFGGGGSAGGMGALTSSGASGISFDVPGFANGTIAAPGGTAWVGERGRELVELPTGSRVTPEDRVNGRSGQTNNITVNVPRETRRDTATQIAQDVAAAVSFASRSN